MLQRGPPCLYYHACHSLLGLHPHLLTMPWGLQESLQSQKLLGLRELQSPGYRPSHHASVLPMYHPPTDHPARLDLSYSTLFKGLQLPHRDAECPPGQPLAPSGPR